MKYTIITDTSSNIPSLIAKEKGIKIIPLSFSVEGEEKTCLDTTNFNAKEFYDLMRNNKKIKTSQITPNQCIDCFTSILDSGEDILFIAMSSGISGSYNSACVARDELITKYPERKIIVVDSLSASFGEGLIVLKAYEYKEQGFDIETVSEKLKDDIKRMYITFTVDKLEYLRNGGRLSGVSAFIGTLLSVKPLLKMNEQGKIIVQSKTRTRRRALELLAQTYDKYIVSPETQIVGISHADCESDALMLSEMIKRNNPPKEIMIVENEPVTGSYLGPKSIVLSFFSNLNIRN